MTAFPSYKTGTISIDAGATLVIGTGAIFNGTNARPGDTLRVAGNPAVDIVDATTDLTQLVIDPWPYAAVVNQPYKITQNSPLRFAGGQAMADVTRIVNTMNTDGFYVFVSDDETVPDPSDGDDGQYARKATTGEEWLKDSGVWVSQGISKPLGVAAPYDNAVTYSLNQVVTISGSSYIYINATPSAGHSPPNATYWALLASKGDVGANPLLPIAAWLTATTYVMGPPASFVSNGGSAYECLIPHTSGTFATDLAASKWGLVAQKGVDGTNGTNGAGYGGSSATSLAIATGSKDFTDVPLTLAYQVGNYVRASSAASGVNFMEGNLTVYSAGHFTINVTKIGGSGTHTDWNFQVAGLPGAGDMLSTNNGSDFSNVDTTLNNLHGVSFAAVQSLTLAQQIQAYDNIAILRRNMFLHGIYSSKAWGAARRVINEYYDGFIGVDAVFVGGSVNLSVASGAIGPTINTGITGTFAQASHVGRGIGGGSGNAGFLFTAPASGTLMSVANAFTSVSVAGSVIARLYSNNAGSPGTLLASTPAVTATVANNGYTFASPPSIVSGISYWIVFEPQSGTSTVMDTCLDQAGYGSGRNVTTTSIVDDHIASNGEDWRVQVNYSAGRNNMTLVTSNQTADASSSNVRALIEYDNSASPTVNTDFTAELSCDGGTHWTAAPLTLITTNSQGGRAVAETGDIACTAGTSIAIRLKTLTNKNVIFYGLAAKWR